MSTLVQELLKVVRRDPRYALEAYQFLYDALEFTQQKLGRRPQLEQGAEITSEHHVSGPELLQGARELALREYGLMARTVFRMWGIQRTDDFGEMVFNLVEANLMSKTDEDSRKDFQNVYDLDEALNYLIRLDEKD